MRIGKLTNQELQEIVISRLPSLSARTVTGANVGADCAWIHMGTNMLVASSDPVTAGGMQSGRLAIHVSCNDIASCGVRPVGILLVIIAPPDTQKEELIHIIEQASETAALLGVDIVGGHTEISDAVNRFVVTTTAFGIVDQVDLVPLGKAMPGDTLLMTKTAAIEGTWIAVMEHEDQLKGILSQEQFAQARAFLDQLSVVQEGVLAVSCPLMESDPPSDSPTNSLSNSTANDSSRSPLNSAVHLMHDATEGGILGAAYEMADFSGTGIFIDASAIPVHPVTKAVSEALGLDALRLISSGSMLIATPEPEKVMEKLLQSHISCTAIGKFTQEGFFFREDHQEMKILQPPASDELYRM